MSRYVLIARHGARQDAEDKNWKSKALRPHDSPLSARGHMQSKALADYIRASGVVIDCIFSSPLHRAIETAVYSARALDLSITVDAGLHEWFDPRAYSDPPALAHYSLGFDHIYGEVDPNNRYLNNNMRVEFESEMRIRCCGVIEQLMSDYEGNILIFTHGSPAREFISHLAGRRVSFPTEAGVRALRLEHDEEAAEIVWSWKPEDITKGDAR